MRVRALGASFGFSMHVKGFMFHIFDDVLVKPNLLLFYFLLSIFTRYCLHIFTRFFFRMYLLVFSSSTYLLVFIVYFGEVRMRRYSLAFIIYFDDVRI